MAVSSIWLSLVCRVLCSECKIFLDPVLGLLFESRVEAVFYEAIALALVVAYWWSFEGLLKDCGSPVVGDEDWRFVVDHLFLHAFDLAPAILMLVLVYLDWFEAFVG